VFDGPTVSRIRIASSVCTGIARGLWELDVGVRLGARSRQDHSYGHFIKKVKFRNKYDNILYVHTSPVDLL
jgi:hypothetical protein